MKPSQYSELDWTVYFSLAGTFSKKNVRQYHNKGVKKETKNKKYMQKAKHEWRRALIIYGH